MPTYFAYGTLLDIGHMRHYCPAAEPLGLATLAGYELDFALCRDGKRGGCTLRESEGRVWGILYSMPEADYAHLEEISGIPQGDWARKNVVVTDSKGGKHETVTYVVPDSPGPFAPPPEYVAPILKGAQENGLPQSYVAKLQKIIAKAQGKA